ncbi:MAG TPA: DUF2231 domain-containing protein [Acidimicrobiales bacterium]|nr:DUF2231 domain-containing protein [Acidimicrobiales bacterium]
MKIEIGRLWGLPAHALLVHIPIVLTPITAAGGLATAFSGWWRRRVGAIVLVSAAVLAVGTQLAIGSGEALREAVRKTPLVRTHVGQSDLLEPVMLALLGSILGLLLIERARVRGAEGRLSGTRRAPTLRLLWCATVLATVVSAATATGLVIRAGHSGARAVWKDSPQLVRPLP